MVDAITQVQESIRLNGVNIIISDEFVDKVTVLTENPENLREILESFDAGVVIIDGDHAVFDGNSLFADMLGYTHEELLKLHVWDWEARFSAEEIKQAAKTVQDASIRFESIQKRKDNTLINVEVNGRSFLKDGAIWQLCICRNLDEVEKKESDLQRSQHNLYEIQRIAHIGSWELDTATGVLLGSDELKKIWGIPDGFEGDIADVMLEKTHPEDLEKVRAAVRGSVEEGVPYDLEYRIFDNEGNIKYLHSRSRVSRDSDGTVNRVYCICQDITAQRKNEEERRLNEVRLLQTQEIAHVGTYEYNLKTKELWWSDEVYKIFGIDPADSINTEKYLECIHPDDLGLLKEMLDLGKEDYHIEYRIIRPDGELRYLSTVVGKHEYKDGERYLIRGTGQDITERKLMEIEKDKLEQQLQHAQKMETIGTLAGGVAHDINNILGIIIGNTELCMDDVPEWNPAYPSLKEIEKAVLRAKDVVRQLLTFSRNMEVRKKPVDIVTVINEALKFLRSTISATIEIEKQMDVSNPDVIADPTQIDQIIMNIFANSAQAMELYGGTIKVSVENTEIDNSSGFTGNELEDGEYVKIVISDNGPGIPAELHQKIFDPYFTTKEVGKGSGMGLAVVQGIVNKHKGAINVKSVPGKGAAFTVLLPCLKKDIEEATPDINLSPNGKRILFVDDEEQITKIATRMLESMGFSVDPETNPQKALELLKNNPDSYDLIITDMAMPQMNALMLFKEIRCIRTDVPVILSSGHNPLIDDKKAEETGFAAYILKPFTRAELSMAVQNALNKSAQ